MYAALLIIERLFLKRVLEKNPIKLINRIYTMFFVMIGWVLFRSDTLLQAKLYIMQLFTKSGGDYTILSYLSMKVIIAFVFAILFLGIAQRIFAKIYDKFKDNTVIVTVDFVIQMAIMCVSIMMIVSGTYNAFIYFQF